VIRQVFLGFGFEWQPCTRSASTNWPRSTTRSSPPAALRLLGYAVNPQPDAEIGLPFIHGVEPEKALYRPLQNFEGGTLLVGTTQSGKGVALANLITQAIRRGDVVSSSTRRTAGASSASCSAPARLPRADTFLEFHPAFPELGVRLDFTFNWQKPTEIASRIQSIMPPTRRRLLRLRLGRRQCRGAGPGRDRGRPNLIKLTKYIEGGIEPVLEASLRRYYDHSRPGWRDLQEMKRCCTAVRGRSSVRPRRHSPHGLRRLLRAPHSQNQRNKVIDAQVRTFRHNREHYQKITANLLPILSMLTSGDLGAACRPTLRSGDKRPIMNFEKIERAGHVLYMCLDSLPDPSVASAIGALALADLAARAGMRYNLGITGASRWSSTRSPTSSTSR
jgi:conjugal transfer pilus assembly protein TraD